MFLILCFATKGFNYSYLIKAFDPNLNLFCIKLLSSKLGNCLNLINSEKNNINRTIKKSENTYQSLQKKKDEKSKIYLVFRGR